MKYIYDPEIHNLTAAREMVPYFIQLFNPKSVIDFGCGLGDWLEAFREQGVNEILGIDFQIASEIPIRIPIENYLTHDLCKPLNYAKRFDLALCLEVAEHLPEVCANQLVETLTSLSDTIIFSAAIPHQGGQGHLNEQSPMYWELLFHKHGYYFYDLIRPRFWNNDKIKWWYRQNSFIVSKAKIDLEIHSLPSTNMYVHPQLFQQQQLKLEQLELYPGIKKSFELLLRAIKFKVSGK